MLMVMKNQLSSYRWLKRFICGTVVGMILGLCLQPSSWQPFSQCNRTSVVYGSQGNSEYEPRFVDAEQINRRTIKKIQTKRGVYRPRYYSTELGVREKLFVGIISSNEKLNQYASMLNETLMQGADNVAIFTDVIPPDYKSNTIVHTMGSDVKKLPILSVIDIISQKYLTDYDFFFLAKDTVYIRGTKLMKFVSDISVSYDVFVGESKDGKPECSLSSGILFSNSVMKSLVISSTNLMMEFLIQMMMLCCLMSFREVWMSNVVGKKIVYTAFRIQNIDQEFNQLLSNIEFRKAVSIYPVTSLQDIMKIHLKVCEIELADAELELKSIQDEIIQTHQKKSAESRPLSWPIGSDQPYESKTRFDMLSWQYFNNTHLIFPDEKTVIRKLIGTDKADVTNIIEEAREWIKKTYSSNTYSFDKLINGYRQFDPTRGMEYIVDLSYCNTVKLDCIVRRLQLFKGLSKMQLLNVPYVTENVIVVLVIPITEHQLNIMKDFMNYLGKALAVNGARYKILFVLLSDQSSSSNIFDNLKLRFNNLARLFQKRGTRIGYVEFHLPSTFSISQIAVMDLVSSRLTENSLVMYIHPEMIFRDDFLNRVRMNTIQGFQVFFPIPFVQYHPSVTYRNETSRKFKIHKDYGHYDRQSFDYASFYYSDYIEARKLISELPIIRSPVTLTQNFEAFVKSNIEIIDMFIRYRSIHIFRAVDKNFLVRYSNIRCKETDDKKSLENCVWRKSQSYGNQKTLASLYIENQNNL
ncbi:Chondroitin sulfate synthase 2 [Nymphon striatum]|nr:Chondroitin sulfate synthase 2 [Nymphon striatum]